MGAGRFTDVDQVIYDFVDNASQIELDAMQVAGTHEHKDVAHVPLAGGVAGSADATWPKGKFSQQVCT